MDILRNEAEQLLQKLPTESSDAKYETLHINSSRADHGSANFEHKPLDSTELRSWLNLTSSSKFISTRIVRMFYHPDDGIASLSSLFQTISQSFGLDPYLISLLHDSVPGFLQLPNPPPSSRPPSTNPPPLNFYINCQAYWIIWSFCPATLSTNAILLSRHSRGGHASYPHLVSQLQRYSSLAGHPLFLALVAASDRIAYVDVFVKEQRRKIWGAERHTGFSHLHFDIVPREEIGKADPEEELEHLAKLSRRASSVLVGLADMVQHLEVAGSILETILGRDASVDVKACETTERKEEEVKSIALLLQPQLSNRLGYVAYIKERAQNQLTVIFNLLARGDTQANIRIAKAAMHDSTSIKTIAVMTMAFLPATFLAALFAVPSLQWDQPKVISGRFWIYWAIAIPATIAVFVLWAAIDQWKELRVKIRAKGNWKGWKD